MEILSDPVFKTQYQKYKTRVKLWESRFTAKHGRKPNKDDIKEADIKIKESYKMYWKLKTRALEETLVDISFSDETEDNVTQNVTCTLSEEIKDDNKSLKDNEKHEQNENSTKNIEGNIESNKKNTSLKDIKSTENRDNENININKSSQECQSQHTINSLMADKNEYKNVKGVWGDHLSKSNEQIPKKKQTLIGRSSSFQLSQNKFTSSSFMKRNPRKSLSTTKTKNKSEKDDNIDTSTSSIVQNTNIELNNKDDLNVDERTKSILGTKSVKVTYVEPKCVAQSIGTILQLTEGHIISRNLNSGWLDRCAKQNNLDCTAFDSLQRLSGKSDSGIESVETSIRSSKENILASDMQEIPQISDEEDFICNSDSEGEHKNKRIRNFKKGFSDQENHPSKKICLKNCTDGLVSNKTVLSEEKCNDLNTTSINSAKNNSIHVNIQKNLINNVDKCNDNVKDILQTVDTNTHDQEDIEKSVKGKSTNRRIRRKIKHDSSDNSDPDFDESEEKKKKVSKTKRTSARRKSKANESTTTNEIKSATKTKRSCRKKKNVQYEEDDLETCDADLENTNDKKPEIYGIETLEAVPRFAICKSNQGDLIEQFARSISSKADDLSFSESAKSKKQLTNKETLEKKIADGKVNENFVRINLKKKVFVRGKKHFNFSKYKKNQWKEKKKELASGEGSLMVADFVEKKGAYSCFKCGSTGHFSKYCPNKNSDDLIPLNEVDESSTFPTLEEAQQMASQNAITAHANRIDRLPEKPSYFVEAKLESTKNETGNKTDDHDLWEPIEDENILFSHKIPEDLVQKLLPPEISRLQPLYELQEDRSCIETPSEVFDVLRKFGHETFRPGQEKAVMRILSGQSTLVTLSTGSGKSLCYQLPAYLYSKYYNCITLVISPLVSLMDDQVTGVPSFLSAACLHTNQTEKVKDNVMQMVKQGKLNILLISPEAVVAGEKSTGFGALLRQLPPIAFACIDEAHCISQWSHNFRPSYLMVCRVLREKLGVKTVLALTATATKATAESIISHLDIEDGMAGVISDIPIPKNLLFTISKDENRDQALIKLLLSERFQKCNSIIVYCTRREECVRIASLLRTASLQDEHNFEKPNAKLSFIAEAYHAGLSAHRRKIVQKAFMNGQIRIVVATVAFGMGLNKPDIRAVIHYNMPGTFEGYVQEVGRAGRDGLPAYCHLFLNPTENKDKLELRRHIYANGIDRHTIRRLLQKVFVPCSCAKLRESKADRKCPGHEVAIPIDDTVAALDISEEKISTLLCYLELHPKRFITLLSSVYINARVSSYNGPQALKQAAQTSPPLAMAIALDLQNGISHESSNVIEFPVVDVASAIGWDSGVVKSHLKNLEWKTVNGVSKRSAISVKYEKLGLRVKAPGDLTETELDEALDALVSRAQSQETSALQQLETISTTLQKFSVPSVQQCLTLNDEMINKSDQLKDVIRNYFDGKILLDIDLKQNVAENEAQVACDVRNLIISYRDNNFTGRAIARIFHGIQSPNYPAYIWGKCRFWRTHISFDFNALCQIATREILALR
ncbi:ATP-dependent DNA helicase Q4 isoform X2 [Frieseomelitta varia]|uniref:ATP-dependent DNA helicase Q4 isoform X2 n=1 Tax=Frieseomelitta varia TaxID=561572 RepID=UPI001CB6B203|nr:ATP-dependent DNA helicase Q4 isoform X2 [Frieseomelitta varia]